MDTQEKTTRLAGERPHVELTGQGGTETLPDCTIIQREAYATIGKIPGEIQEIPLQKEMTIGRLFEKIGISSLDKCEIQRNGQTAQLGDIVQSGDTILAIAKIRGN